MSITLIGTSHISPKSADKVRKKIVEGNYDFVAVELDRGRLTKLFSRDTSMPSFFQLARAVGVSGAVFAKIGHYVEHKLGGRIGMQPGVDMKTAVVEAGKKKVPVALIDQPIEITLQRFTKAFTFKEKLRLLKSMFRFTKIPINIEEAPDEQMVVQLLAELERASPALAKVLVYERNDYMVKKLLQLQEAHPEANILAVVGAGHVPGMNKSLNKAKEKK